MAIFPLVPLHTFKRAASTSISTTASCRIPHATGAVRDSQQSHPKENTAWNRLDRKDANTSVETQPRYQSTALDLQWSSIYLDGLGP